MKYNMLLSFTHSLRNKNIKKCINMRYASAGLKVWDKIITTEHKHEIEKYWKDKINNFNTAQLAANQKFYVLSMFPYPSGSLHMGHVRVYTISDTVARFYKMQGKYVIHPMGWDAFGLPAENAAIEKQVDPAEWTKQNIQNMKEQLSNLGCAFDTYRELSTCDPNYYKWTQELFLKLYENDLLYQKETFVNWDPIDETVLADEQVDENNRSWRSGAIVEKRLLKQWFIKTTVFAESLLEGLKDEILMEWNDIIKLQKNWIGNCTGINIDFQLISDIQGYPKSITLWTDKPEFIEHAKFVALSTNNLISKIEKPITQGPLRQLDAKVVNPFTNQHLPIYVISKEILTYPSFRDDYIGIPCLSDVDSEICKATGISYKEAPIYSIEEQEKKRFNILQNAKKRKIGGYMVSSKLRDWLISRQRYWGTPIPIIHCEKCGSQPVPRDLLPVILPKIEQGSVIRKLTLKDANEWLNTFCPKCNGPATRETDTMDTFVDSSWYFMRFIDPKNESEMISKEKAHRYLPVDLYIGGKEHATLHLYYARFMSHFLYQLGLIPTREPFKQLLVQGMVMGKSYCTKNGKYVKPNDVEINENECVDKRTKELLMVQWEKMSKSKYNGVDPSKMLSKYSIDTIRLLILADVAPTSHRNWSEDTFPGILNWQRRLWQTVSEFIEVRKKLGDLKDLKGLSSDEKFQKENAYMFDSRNYYVHGVTFNITRSQQLSVAISKMQGLTNSIRKSSETCVACSREYERALAVQIIMLAPFAPHFASEMWAGFCSAPHRICVNNELQWDKNVLDQNWPEVDLDYNLKLQVRINSKNFTTLRIPRRKLDTMSEDDLLQLVMNDAKIKKYVGNRKITKVHLKSEIGCGANISIQTKKNVVVDSFINEAI